tara:strand:+ start:3437 stop:4621 length:1185 start_codon:yes stop_codon:yes gene_type:complete
MQRLLIIEPQLSGHHFRYLQWITSAACDRGLKVIIATDNCFREDPTLASLQRNQQDSLTFHFDDFSWTGNNVGTLALIKRELHYWKKLQSTFQKVDKGNKVDHVLLPFADICLYALALNPRPFGRCSWSAIAMRPAFHCHKMGLTKNKPGLIARTKEWLFFRLAGSDIIGKLCVIDPCLAQYVAVRQPQSRIIYLQDPVDINVPAVSRENARKILEIETTRSVILLYGAIDWRKGTKELLEAQLSLPLAQQPIVVLAGRQTQEIRNWLSNAIWQKPLEQGHLKVFDRFITEEEENLLFSACDAVWLGYRGHLGSSGVLWQTLAFQRAIIGCNEGLIGWFIRTYNLGINLQISDKKAVASALSTLPRPANFTYLKSKLPPISGRDFADRLLQAIT